MSSSAWKGVAGLAAIAVGLSVAAPADPPPARKPATYNESRCSRDNLRRVGLALHSYADEHGHLPRDVTDKAGKPLLSWRVAILPYLDLEFLHAQFKLDEPWDGPTNRKLLAFMPNPYRGPGQDRAATDTFVQAVVGEGAIFDPKAKVRLQDVTDGLTNTLLLAEAGPAVPWTKPADVPFDPTGKPPVLVGPFADAVHVLAGDGSTHRMALKPDAELLRNFILRDDGNAFELDKLKAAPLKPMTEEDRKLLAEWKASATKKLRRVAGFAEDRFKCEQELRKLGDVPQPDPAKLETLEELEVMSRALDQQWSVDMDEYYRLIEHVRKVAPKAADRIELGRSDRITKEEAGGP